MSQKQGFAYRAPIANGSARRRTDKDFGNRSDKIMCHVRSGTNISGNTVGGHGTFNNLNSDCVSPAENAMLHWEGPFCGGRGGEPERTRNDRLLHITMRLIGQLVEVQVKNGSIYSGIFHTANIDKDYGIVLKMAHLTKDGNAKGGTKETFKNSAKRAPVKTLIILANDLVQVIAKGVPFTGDRMRTSRASDNRYDIITDSLISKAHPIEVERELTPWTPDKDGPEDVDLENTFQNTCYRNWDQFETNKSLFGVESTFDEGLYTTKLERGPQTRDLEIKASEIARQMERHKLRNSPSVEECFANESETFDEESKCSSVHGSEDVGEDNDDKHIDSHNEKTFGSASAGTEDVLSLSNDSKRIPSMPAGEPDKKAAQSCQISSADFSGKEIGILPSEVSNDGGKSTSVDASEIPQKMNYSVAAGSISSGSSVSVDFSECSKPAFLNKSLLPNKPVSQQEQLPLTSKTGISGSVSELPASSSASSALVSSLDSSMGTALRKSTLNPKAKEFKLNPDAKSYTPFFTTPRQPSSVVHGPIYVPGSVSPLTPMQSVPLGLGGSLIQQALQPPKFPQYNNSLAAAGVSTASYLPPSAAFVPHVSGTSVPAVLPAPQPIKIPPPGQQLIPHSFSGQQPIRYTSQTAPLQQAPAYVHPGGQMYSQPMVYQPGQVVYIQPYPNDMMQVSQISPPQGSVPARAAAHQAQQLKHRGTGVHGMQYCVAPPFVSGQQPYIQSAPVSHLPNTLQPSPGVRTPTSLPGIQIPQGIVAGPTLQNGSGFGSNGIWVGGKGATGNFQQ
uniref:TSA: Wollemia nobilis Ref_Wollemi_Transcript_9924_2981 transcribed RNA sequence n=1 Tax=Wollemia nobilis TaxID=56998 RepID=A0A0C9RMX2_9CONI